MPSLVKGHAKIFLILFIFIYLFFLCPKLFSLCGTMNLKLYFILGSTNIIINHEITRFHSTGDAHCWTRGLEKCEKWD